MQTIHTKGNPRNDNSAMQYFRLANLCWDIAKAKGIVADGRKPIPVPVKMLGNNHGQPTKDGWKTLGVFIDKNHLASVDPDKPGIAAVAIDEYLLIDGHHRAARCEELGRKTYEVYLLSPTESDQCLDANSLRILKKIRARCRNRGSRKQLSRK